MFISIWIALHTRGASIERAWKDKYKNVRKIVLRPYMLKKRIMSCFWEFIFHDCRLSEFTRVRKMSCDDAKI